MYYLTKCDNNINGIYLFLKSKIIFFFGKISYSLYLIHEPIIFYICFIIYIINKIILIQIETKSNKIKLNWNTIGIELLNELFVRQIKLILNTKSITFKEKTTRLNQS